MWFVNVVLALGPHCVEFRAAECPAADTAPEVLDAPSLVACGTQCAERALELGGSVCCDFAAGKCEAHDGVDGSLVVPEAPRVGAGACLCGVDATPEDEDRDTPEPDFGPLAAEVPRVSAAVKASSLFASEVRPTDPVQGALGDCWLLASLSAVGRYSGVRRLFRQQFLMQGTHDVQLYDVLQERWRRLTVSDTVPMTFYQGSRALKTRKAVRAEARRVRDGESEATFTGLYAKLSPRGTTWPLVLEKAFAQLLSPVEQPHLTRATRSNGDLGYPGLAWGHPSSALVALLGSEDVVTYRKLGTRNMWRPEKLIPNEVRRVIKSGVARHNWVNTSQRYRMDGEDLWRTLVEADAKHWPMTAMDVHAWAAVGLTTEERTDDGLFAGHVYALLQVREVRPGYNVLCEETVWVPEGGGPEDDARRAEAEEKVRYHGLVRAPEKDSAAGFAYAGPVDSWICEQPRLRAVRKRGVFLSSVPKSLRFVQLRNPWGDARTWTGPWGPGSGEWASRAGADVKAVLGGGSVADGSHWMLLEDFQAHFGSVQVAEVDMLNFSPEPPECNTRWGQRMLGGSRVLVWHEAVAMINEQPVAGLKKLAKDECAYCSRPKAVYGKAKGGIEMFCRVVARKPPPGKRFPPVKRNGYLFPRSGATEE